MDGFAFPIPSAHLGEYQKIAAAAAEVWKEHGALDYREYIADDLELEGTRSFVDALGVSPGETVVFGWVTFASRESRDAANAKVAADPRMVELMASGGSGFDATRMAYGGFRLLIG